MLTLVEREADQSDKNWPDRLRFTEGGALARPTVNRPAFSYDRKYWMRTLPYGGGWW